MVAPSTESPSGATTMICRPLGLIEKYHASRNHLGIGGRVVTAASYSHSPLTLLTSLTTLLTALPALSTVIFDEATESPSFALLSTVTLGHHVNVQGLREVTEEAVFAWVVGGGGPVEKIVDDGWEEVGVLPPWRVGIFYSEEEGKEPGSCTVLFTAHHAIFDGMSHAIFHKQLISAISSSSSPSSTTIESLLTTPITIPPSLLHLSQEQAIPLRLGPWQILRDLLLPLLHSLLPYPLRLWPTPWTGPPIRLFPTPPSHYHVLSVPPVTTTTLLSTTRTNKTSLTALLHVLVSYSIAHSVPEAQALASSTPINLRPFASVPDASQTIADYVSFIPLHFPPQTLTHLRTLPPPSSLFSSSSSSYPVTLPSSLFPLAATLCTTLQTAASSAPSDTPVTLLRLVRSFRSIWLSKPGTHRSNTWEVSNLGSVGVPASQLLFAQTGMPSGAAVCLSVAGVAGGGLVVAVTWRGAEEVDEVFGRLVGDLKGLLGAEEVEYKNKSTE